LTLELEVKKEGKGRTWRKERRPWRCRRIEVGWERAWGGGRRRR